MKNNDKNELILEYINYQFYILSFILNTNESLSIFILNFSTEYNSGVSYSNVNLLLIITSISSSL